MFNIVASSGSDSRRCGGLTTQLYRQARRWSAAMIIGIPVYDGVDLLDVMGPYEMFKWIDAPGITVEVLLIAETACQHVTSRNGVTFQSHDTSFGDIGQIDVLWVPGGDPDALKALMTEKDKRYYLDFLIKQSAGARIVASVCEGALLLAQAGLLDGYQATTHWAFIPCLMQFPNIKIAPGYPRFVIDRNRITGGGISSGLDEALGLIQLVTSTEVAQAVQLNTQYYPNPPVTSEIPHTVKCPFSW
jgi:transcriptional regulator GlxA family with amidase domain